MVVEEVRKGARGRKDGMGRGHDVVAKQLEDVVKYTSRRDAFSRGHWARA